VLGQRLEIEQTGVAEPGHRLQPLRSAGSPRGRRIDGSFFRLDGLAAHPQAPVSLEHSVGLEPAAFLMSLM
jgi:hypothetical protein